MPDIGVNLVFPGRRPTGRRCDGCPCVSSGLSVPVFRWTGTATVSFRPPWPHCPGPRRRPRPKCLAGSARPGIRSEIQNQRDLRLTAERQKAKDRRRRQILLGVGNRRPMTFAIILVFLTFFFPWTQTKNLAPRETVYDTDTTLTAVINSSTHIYIYSVFSLSTRIWLNFQVRYGISAIILVELKKNHLLGSKWFFLVFVHGCYTLKIICPSVEFVCTLFER